MSEKTRNPETEDQDLANVEELEVEPLSDEDLDEVAGGTSSGCCSCSGCVSRAV